MSNETLRGTNLVDEALVLQYLEFAETEILPSACTWVYPTLGFKQYNKQDTDKAQEHIKVGNCCFGLLRSIFTSYSHSSFIFLLFLPLIPLPLHVYLSLASLLCSPLILSPPPPISVKMFLLSWLMITNNPNAGQEAEWLKWIVVRFVQTDSLTDLHLEMSGPPQQLSCYTYVLGWWTSYIGRHRSCL